MFTKNVRFLQKVVISHPHKNTFLALKRSAQENVRPNDWDLPGGNVEYGEQPEEGLIREVQEETGLTIKNLTPLTVFIEYNDDFCYLIVGYKAQAISETIALSVEHPEYRWVTQEGFINLTKTEFINKIISKVFI